MEIVSSLSRRACVQLSIVRSHSKHVTQAMKIRTAGPLLRQIPAGGHVQLCRSETAYTTSVRVWL
jgi:hypothetical protein